MLCRLLASYINKNPFYLYESFNSFKSKCFMDEVREGNTLKRKEALSYLLII